MDKEEEDLKKNLTANVTSLTENYKQKIEQIENDDVFTDSDSDLEDPIHEGIRIVDATSKNDKAEFDRVRLKRKKIYEDKLAEFNLPEHMKDQEGEVIKKWIEKQILKKVSNKLKVIESGDKNFTVRNHEGTKQEAEVIMDWVNKVRTFKVVLYGSNKTLEEELRNAILVLRENFPKWKITAKLGDPKAREDHDKMHKK